MSRHAKNYDSSSDESEDQVRGKRQPTKNAILARKNRQKKKAYVKGLENQIAALKNNARKYKGLLGSQVTHIEELQSEIKYLKAALANAAEIGALVRRIRGPIGTERSRFPSWGASESRFPSWEPPKMPSPMLSPVNDSRPLSPLNLDFPECKRMPNSGSFSDHNYSTPYGSDDESHKNIGVCLHVSNKKMSLEFCSKCNESALQSWVYDED